ncbi:MAG: hypothetical protein AAGN46_15960 [Acidobacteriota bacterium]
MTHDDRRRREIDPAPYLHLLEERFGIPLEAFADFAFFRPNRNTVWIRRRELDWSGGAPALHAVGFPFFHPTLRFPRPTNAAVLRFGHLARRSVLDLNRMQLAAFVRREERPLDADPPLPAGDHGYVIARSDGDIVGLGIVRPAGDGRPTPTLEGLVPSSWIDDGGLAIAHD